MGVFALALGGEDLVRGDGDRLDLFDLAGIFADFVGSEGGALQQLIAPLPGRHRVGDQNERVGFRRGHGARADEGFTGAAGQHDDAGTGVEEVGDGLVLVVAQCPAVFPQGNLVRGSGGVAGEVFGRPAELHELLLERSAGPGFDQKGVRRRAADQQGGDALGTGDFGEHRLVVALQDERAFSVALDHQTAVPANGFGDIH